MRVILTFLSVAIVVAMATVVACTLVPALAPQDWPDNPPLPAQQDCEIYEEVLEPAFVVGYFQSSGAYDTDLNFFVGSQTFTVGLTELDSLQPRLTNALATEWPQYPVAVYVSDDYQDVFFRMLGTNDADQFRFAVYVRYNGLKHYWGWISQGFIFFSSLTFPEAVEVTTSLPSVNYVTYAQTPFDSLQCDSLGRIVLGDCKAGRWWADFRFGGPWDPALIQEYIDAGWQQISEFAPGTPLSRSAQPTFFTQVGHTIYPVDISP